MIHVKCLAKVWHMGTGCHKGYIRSEKYNLKEWYSSNPVGAWVQRDSLRNVCVCAHVCERACPCVYVCVRECVYVCV